MTGLPRDTVLRSRRCRYRLTTDRDVEHMWSAAQHPGFTDGMQWEPPSDREPTVQRIREDAEEWHAGSAYSFAIETDPDGVFVGRITIRRVEEADLWDIGFWIHPTLWGRGYGTEAAATMLAFGFERLGARRIEAAAATWNEPSWRLLERVGMQRVRVNPEGLRKKGQWVPEYLYAVDRETFTST
jgi:RimJ/RimL family protein N-acetyltransferase